MPFTVRCGSDVHWYPTGGDCGACNVCGHGVARCDKLLREGDWGDGVGSGRCGVGGGGSTDASGTTDFNWFNLLVGVFSFETFLSGGGLLDGQFLTFWSGGILGRVGERSLRFLDSGRRSPFPLFQKKSEEAEAHEGERLRSEAPYWG